MRLLDSPFAERDRLAYREEVPALHGETLGGVPLTLLDGWVLGGTRYGIGNGSQVSALFTTLVSGVHVATAEEVRGGWAGIAVQGLLEVLTGGKVDHPLLSVRAEQDSHDQMRTAVPGMEMVLHAGASESWSRFNSSVTVGAGARFEFDHETTLAEVDAAVGPLVDMVTFSTRAAAAVTRLRLGPDLRRGVGSGAELRVIRAREHPAPVERSGLYYALMLNPATVPDGAELFANWYALRSRLGPVWPLFFSTLAQLDLPLETQLLNLASFGEAYHRTLHDEAPLTEVEHVAAQATMLAALPNARHRDVYKTVLHHANAQSQRRRLRWLTERAVTVLAPDWQLKPAVFANQIADTRNWHTHLGERGAAVQEGADLIQLLHRLDLVLSVNLMLDLQLDDNTIREQVASGLRLAGLP